MHADSVGQMIPGEVVDIFCCVAEVSTCIQNWCMFSNRFMWGMRISKQSMWCSQNTDARVIFEAGLGVSAACLRVSDCVALLEFGKPKTKNSST